MGDPINDCGCVAQFVGNWLSAQYYMFVNKEGKRFVKEDGTRYEDLADEACRRLYRVKEEGKDGFYIHG